jgi:hypothetical protein
MGKVWNMGSNPIGNEMSKQTQTAVEEAEIAGTPSPVAPSDGDAQKLQESRKTLSENEEWLQKNSGKLVSK